MKVFALVGVILLLANPCFALFSEVDSLSRGRIQKIQVSPTQDNLLFAASASILFSSENKGKSWHEVFFARGEEIVNFIFDKTADNRIFVATQSAVYALSSRNKARIIFKLPPELIARCISQREGAIYLGTSEGLYVRRQDSSGWKRLAAAFDAEAVLDMDFTPRGMYVVSSGGVYFSSDRKNFSRKFILGMVSEEEGEEEIEPVKRVIKADIFDGDILYLGTGRGLFISSDAGDSWRKADIPIVENASIREIRQAGHTPGVIYLATERGLFSVDLKRKESSELFQGLYTRDISSLDFDSQGTLFVATPRGLFKKDNNTGLAAVCALEGILAGIPSIQQVQEAALAWNEVHPEKIKEWRNRLKLKGLFPRLSLNYSKKVWGTAGTGTYDGKAFVGPRDWNMGLTWDLGDILWHSSHTSIDVRSRLNTQLRNNVLDDVSGLYFAWIRQRLDLENIAADDPEGRLKSKLRLSELAAGLDAYTGGFFSRMIPH